MDSLLSPNISCDKWSACTIYCLILTYPKGYGSLHCMKQLALAHLFRELFHKACIPYRNTAYHSVLAPILLH